MNAHNHIKVAMIIVSPNEIYFTDNMKDINPLLRNLRKSRDWGKSETVHIEEIEMTRVGYHKIGTSNQAALLFNDGGKSWNMSS